MSEANGQAWEFREEPCGVCGGSDFRVLGFHGGAAHRVAKGVKTRIVRCENCSLIYPNPMPYPAGEDRRYGDTEDYFGNVMHASDSGRLALGDRLAGEAERILGRRGRFLDVGCGRGEVVAGALARGWDAEGCDISAAFAAHARQATGAKIRTGTVEQIGYPDASFDVVTMIEVIEHLYNPLQTARELRRILRPGGLLYVSTPNEASLYQIFGNMYYRLRGRDWVVNLCPTWNLYHVQGFSPQSLRYLLEGNGFRVEELVLYPAPSPLPNRPGLWGTVERVGTRAVDFMAKTTGKNPYMYAWARREADVA